MADISVINIPNEQGDNNTYNIKDTTVRNGLTDRPTSFVGTRSEWNALPVATQVKYSLVNLIGEGIYKNNGTELDDIANKASKNFQGTIAEWNALTTEEKKAYDHASIPDSIDGGVTFPADKVIMTGGGNVEDALSGYTALSTTDTKITTDTDIAITNMTYKNIILVGYVGSNAGGKRWYMHIPTCVAYSSTYNGVAYANGNLLVISFMLLANKIRLSSATSDVHVIGVYGGK